MAYKNKEEQKKQHKKYNRGHKKEISKNKRRYYLENHEEKIEKRRKYLRENSEKIRGDYFKRTYNLSYEDWLKMWEEQDRKCLICGKTFDSPSNAQVDHDHKTKKVRGLLCNKCNFAIGLLNDDPKLAMKLTEYLMEA